MSDLALDWFELVKGNACHNPSDGRFCEGSAGASVKISSGRPEYDAVAESARKTIDGLDAKFRIADANIQVTDLASSKLVKSKQVGVQGAADITGSGNIEIFARPKFDSTPATHLWPSRAAVVAVHEYGHITDRVLGSKLGVTYASSHTSVVSALAKDYNALKKGKKEGFTVAKERYGYLATDGKEVFAEAFAVNALGRSYAPGFRNDFPNTVAAVGDLFK